MEGKAWVIVGDKRYELGNIKTLVADTEVRIPDTVRVPPIYTWRLYGLAKDYYSRAEAIEGYKRFRAASEANAKLAVQTYREKVGK